MKTIRYKKEVVGIFGEGDEKKSIKSYINIVTNWSKEAEEKAKIEAYNNKYYIEDVVENVADEIQFLKDNLSATDYKIIKCYECQLVGEELPYDIVSLHLERQKIRDEINKLQNQ